ncbi:hypothetical protein SAY86_010130 [Trapa natans]|uniref:Uncharacterized protein n=1 Tax=Trapa natans TaxID=22666 RepID=A0AAN7L547_TRANT|nr:hypothetical protein SAY86_010130 [Trapa natans]
MASEAASSSVTGMRRHAGVQVSVSPLLVVAISGAGPLQERLDRFPVWAMYLSKPTVYLLSLPQYPRTVTNPLQCGSSWLIKVREDDSRRMNLLNPLSWADSSTLSVCHPLIVDSSSFRVSELCCEFVTQT